MDPAKLDYGGITDIQTAKVIAKRLFQSYSHGDNTLDKRALERMLADTYKLMNKEFQPSQDDLTLYSDVLDKNSDGKVTLEDVETLAIKFLVGDRPPPKRTYAPNVKQRLDVARRLFEQFDTDKSGYLTEHQIPNLLRETYRLMGMKFQPNAEDIRSWMKMTDLDGDGKVSLEDYENLIIRSLEKVGIRIFE